MLAALVGLVLAAAWHDRGTAVDDAYITFRYAENLRDGHGLRWNPDAEPCEGYSNLSYVVLIAALGAAGIDPVAAALLLASASLIALALLLWWAGRAAGQAAPLALVPAVLVFGQGDIEVHASRGLETCLFGLLAVCQLTTAARLAATTKPARGHALLAAFVGTALFLTRPDGVLISLCCWITAGWRVRRDPGRRGPLAMAVGVWVLSGAAYAAWKLYLFGYLLPNPFYAKSGGAGFKGLDETLAFVRDHGWLLACLCLVGLAAWWRRPRASATDPDTGAEPTTTMAIVATAAWLAYGSKIVHEIGFANRFLWPTALIAAFGATRGLAALGRAAARWPGLRQLTWLPLAAAIVLVWPTLAGHVERLGRPPRTDTTTNMFLRLGRAIAATGFAPRLTLYCSHAGATPYAAGAHHVDPAGLVDNGFCLRTPDVQRAAYASGVLDELDIVSWHLFPASPGCTSFDQDPRARGSTYLDRWCLGNDPAMDTGLRKQLEGVSRQQREQDTYGLMLILRDFATLVGEMNDQRRHWRTFVYVWKASPQHDELVAHLRPHVDIPVEQIDYDGWPE